MNNRQPWTDAEDGVLKSLPPDATPEQVKRLFPTRNYNTVLRRRRLLANKNPKQEDITMAKSLEQRFQEFLMRGRTEKELRSKFGDATDELLKGKYEGLELFTQRNHYFELVYILLPKVSTKVKLTPKRWHYHVGQSEDGIRDPYLLIQLPNFKGELEILPLFDVHYGNVGHRREKLLSYIRYIKEKPNCYAILGGDLMENALDDGRGMSYDQNRNPQTQLEDMIQMLSPIAHKILVAVPGNHEWRTYRVSGIDVMALIASRLEIPYFDGPVLMSVSANTHMWNFYVKHGETNSKTKGGKLNAANRPKEFTAVIHFFLSGHVHDRLAESETCIVPDPVHARLIYMDQWTVIAPSFLRWQGTYAYRAGYKPPARGGVAMILADNGSYRAELT